MASRQNVPSPTPSSNLRPRRPLSSIGQNSRLRSTVKSTRTVTLEQGTKSIIAVDKASPKAKTVQGIKPASSSQPSAIDSSLVSDVKALSNSLKVLEKVVGQLKSSRQMMKDRIDALEVAQVDLKVELALLRHPGSVPPLVDPLDFQESSPSRNDTSTPPSSAKSKEAVYTSSPLPARYQNTRAIRADNLPLEQVPETTTSGINGGSRLSLLGRAQLNSSWAGWASREQTPERGLEEETEVLVTPGTEKVEVEAVSMESVRGTKEACEDIVIAEAEGSRVREGDWTEGERLGVTRVISVKEDNVAEGSIPMRDIQGEATAMEGQDHDLTTALGQENSVQEYETANLSAEGLLDDAEISVLLELEEESGDYQSDEEDIKIVVTTHPSSQAHFSSDTDSVDLVGADFGVNDNQSWEIQYRAERQRREEVGGQLAYILSELDKLCVLDKSPELS